MKIAKNDDGQFVLAPDNNDDVQALEYLYKKGVMGRIKDVASISYDSERIELKIIGHEIGVLEKDLARLRGESGSCEHRMGKPVWDIERGVVKNARLVCPDCGKANNDVRVSVEIDGKGDGKLVSHGSVVAGTISVVAGVSERAFDVLANHVEEFHKGKDLGDTITLQKGGDGFDRCYCKECETIIFQADWNARGKMVSG